MEQGTLIPRPTESELELLQILWQKEPATVRDIYDALNEEKASGYTTVLKLLQIMTTKGLVVRDEANRADLTNRLFAGSAAQLALHALSMGNASDDELAEIRALLERRQISATSLGQNGTSAHKSSQKDRP